MTPPSQVEWNGRTEGGLTAVRWFTWFSLCSGPRLGPILLAIGTWCFLPFLSRRRQGSEYFFTQLRGYRASPLRRLWDTYRQFLAFVLCWHERIYAFVRGTHFLQARVKGAEHIPEQRGVILLTAHIGNFELGAWLLNRAGRPVNVVMIDTEAASVNAFLDGLRGRERPNIIAVNRSPLSALAILAALRRGEIVCMQGDRATGSQEARVPFLGRPAPFPLGPYQLARVSGAVVLPTLCRRLGRAQYEFEMFPPLDVAVPERAVEAYVRILEAETRARPYYWFNLFSFWDGAHRPAGSAKAANEAPLRAAG